MLKEFSQFKLIFIVVFVFCSLNTIGQNRRGGGGGNPGGNTRMNAGEMPEYKASDAVGILVYKPEKVIKKIKVKDQDTKNNVRTILIDHNGKMDSLKTANSELFSQLNKLVKQKRTEVRVTRNMSEMREIQKNIRTLLNPIRQNRIAIETAVNADLKNILTEEAYQRWLDYQKSRKFKQKQGQQPQNQKRRLGTVTQTKRIRN